MASEIHPYSLTLFFLSFSFYLYTGPKSCSVSAGSHSCTAAESRKAALRTRDMEAWEKSLQRGTAALLSSPSSLSLQQQQQAQFNQNTHRDTRTHTHWTAGARTIPLWRAPAWTVQGEVRRTTENQGQGEVRVKSVLK